MGANKTGNGLSGLLGSFQLLQEHFKFGTCKQVVILLSGGSQRIDSNQIVAACGRESFRFGQIYFAGLKHDRTSCILAQCFFHYKRNVSLNQAISYMERVQKSPLHMQRAQHLVYSSSSSSSSAALTAVGS